ncbi:MAG TPA: hypothetical protein VN381_13275, partial [Anaerovoracaceae bacterium]|nr:hypothetical protein [Anaerovoracaceae bacterium]
MIKNNRSSYALAMLGSSEDIGKISEPMRRRGIDVSRKNYITLEELTSVIENSPNVEYVFLSDSGMRGIRDGKYSVPVQIAGMKKDLLIAVFFSVEKRSVKYLKWAAGLGIHHIYYSDDPVYTDGTGNFDFNKILQEIKEKKRIFSEEAVPDADSDSGPAAKGEPPRIIKVEVEKEVVREVPVEIIREIPVEKVIEKEVIVRVPAENSGRTLFGKIRNTPVKRAAKIIGVYASSSGAGATSLCVYFGKYLADKGNRVAVLERNRNPHLKGLNEKRVDIFQSALIEVEIGSYDFILLDFGVLYGLTREEPVIIADSREDIQESQRIYGVERKYCTNTIMTCSAAPWRVNEARFFLDDLSADNTGDWIFYFNGNPETKEFKKLMKDYYAEGRMVFSHENKKAFD